jgi:surfeit locus 1 family protein
MVSGSGFQFTFLQRHYLVKFRLSFFLLCLLFFVLLCQLGVWQLHRYHFKKTLLTTYEQRVDERPQDFLAVVQKGDVQFQHVQVVGNYLPEKTMLVQNRVHDEQVGYDVITPFQIKGQNKLLLVNRGWVKSLMAEHNLQNVTSVTGVIKLLNEYQFILGKNILQPLASPVVMQKVDTLELSALLQAPVYPFILRLDAVAPNGFVREWSAVNVNPQRHMGYAVQWFLMALVLLGAYLCFCIERVENNGIER